MANALAEVNRQDLGLQVCPVCGKRPKVIQTMFGTSFVLCFPHAETRTVESPEEAIRDWNSGKILGRYAEAQN